ncbi:uncharacterized protein EV154DRAFT_502332 [Mucor mucedo]|uniref:uncharacterized protein n=1 Tax=Mucor mucedo TaxID=29922 RepID=UPI00222062F1|nr:uncharacterized protein EV154DRAFT_502332 [Mucor mucedo]KAI7893287.1 hypothetical protein EV154DRAFT_502332 [Mucor mucedo]
MTFLENQIQVFPSKSKNVCKGNTDAGNICKVVLNSVHFATDRKKAIKKEKKKKELVSGDKDKHMKMWVLKVMKLHYCNLQEDDYANEDTFLYFVLAPILKSLLRINSRTALLFGETNLKSKAAEINRHLFDDERRYAGPKIDVIVKDKKYNLEIMIIEVSGPFEKVNNTLFLEDRNKICKNLKAMFKNIVSHMEVPSKTFIRKLKLYGLQFYNGRIFVYSICKPCDHSYVFVNDYSFSSLGPSSINPQQMPSFVKNMYGILYLIENTQHILDKFLDNIDIVAANNNVACCYTG